MKSRIRPILSFLLVAMGLGATVSGSAERATVNSPGFQTFLAATGASRPILPAGASPPPAQIDTGLQRRARPADERDIMQMQSIALLILAGIALTLYIMRRRSRQGKRTPKF